MLDLKYWCKPHITITQNVVYFSQFPEKIVSLCYQIIMFDEVELENLYFSLPSMYNLLSMHVNLGVTFAGEY